MKSPVLNSVTSPLSRIVEMWRAEYERDASAHGEEKEAAELRHSAWRDEYKRAFKKNGPLPIQPDVTFRAPTQKRLLLTDATYEKLHEILSDNPAGVLVLRDELTGWLGDMERQGRESERSFYLQSWNGDMAFSVDRVGRGSIHVPAVCISLFGNIQPTRLRSYIADAVTGGASDDGLFQRLQVLVWPDPPGTWKLIDRPPNGHALSLATKVFSTLANLSADSPVELRFEIDAQQLFYEWWGELRRRSAMQVDCSQHS